MRQGPDYRMPITRDEWGVKIPLELIHDFDSVDYVTWHDNGDGTYLLIPFDKYSK